MGFITWLKEQEGKRKRREQERLVEVMEERKAVRDELEFKEALNREESALAVEKRKLKQLKYDKYLGWLR